MIFLCLRVSQSAFSISVSVLTDFCCTRSDLVSAAPRREIGWEEHLQDDPLSVERDDNLDTVDQWLSISTRDPDPNPDPKTTHTP